jgi:hypothetical protein
LQDFLKFLKILGEIKRSSVSQDEFKSPKTQKRRKRLKRVFKLAQIFSNSKNKRKAIKNENQL